MKKKWTLFLLFYLLFLQACQKENEPILSFQNPSNFPEPSYDFENNPITRAGFELGKKLFYDGILSRDGSVSCASCHIPSAAFTQHGHDVSHGIDDKLTLRNSMPIMNLAWQKQFFWDGGVPHLDLFAIAPIEAENEMDETLGNVLEKLRKHPEYPSLFEKAFGSKEITTDRFLDALSQFQLMAISANSKYDKYSRNEGVSLDEKELAGLQLFKQKCSACHSGELFSDFKFRNNGLVPRVFKDPETGVDTTDTGRYRITLYPENKYQFKVPSLRNIELTKPYMHDGRFRTLEDVLEHYNSGVKDSPTLDPILKQNGTIGIPLSNTEKEQLVAFLKTLTDTEFINNPLLNE
ncbi:MAG: cytochrome c peroxidase [Thermonemataceae bacterium]|nr:cytochrome c peroxidase [Thermonemataceae bacterium]